MRAIIFCIGELDRFTVDPYEAIAGKAIIGRDAVVEINELAALTLEKDNATLHALFEEDTEYICCASRPRTVRALLDFGGIEFRIKSVTWISLPYDVVLLKSQHGSPWFPVIDRERCTGCGVCHDYCLFSSYSRDDTAELNEIIQVSNPLNCKPGCPACARLCKSGALIFPFNPEPEINGALEEVGRQSQSELLKDFEADPMKVLAERRKKRQLIDESKFADAERDRERFSGS